MGLLETTIKNPILAQYTCLLVRLDGRLKNTRNNWPLARRPGSRDYSGSVSLHSDTALIGAIGSAMLLLNEKRCWFGVRVYRSSTDGGRSQQSKLRNDAAVSDQFGRSVSLHGDTALIGAWKDDDNQKSNSGSVYVFKAPPLHHLFRHLRRLHHFRRRLHLRRRHYSSHLSSNMRHPKCTRAMRRLRIFRYFRLYGDTALIGAPADDNSKADSGSVSYYSFDSDGRLRNSLNSGAIQQKMIVLINLFLCTATQR